MDFAFKPTQERLVKDITNPNKNEKAKCFSSLNDLLHDFFNEEKEAKENEESIITKIISLINEDSKQFNSIMGIFNAYYSARPKERAFLLNLIESLYSKSPVFNNCFHNLPPVPVPCIEGIPISLPDSYEYDIRGKKPLNFLLSENYFIKRNIKKKY